MRKSSVRMSLASTLTALIAVLVLTLTANAEDTSVQGPKGVAFVEAPEQGGGVCFSDNADKGFACARKQCTDGGADQRDCLRVRWCYPAGWTADIFMQHREGPHWHHILCGWQSRGDLMAAVRIACEGSMKEYLIGCSVTRIWSPAGGPQDLD